MVLCDGIGSAPYSHIGAGMACRAAKASFLMMTKKNLFEPEDFIDVLTDIWISKFPPGESSDFATTCSFCIISRNGCAFWGSLGDSIFIVKEEGGIAVQMTLERKLFGDLTDALGMNNKDDWQFGYLNNISPGFKALLASDGVGDDLNPDKFTELLDYLYEKYTDLNPYYRWRSLSKELYHWNTPGHLDDKTLAYLWVDK